MLGYVVVKRSELKVREDELYRGYYCGLCKSVGKRLGQIPRLALSFDCVFLAIVLASLEEEQEQVKEEHCIIHPIKKNPTVYSNKALDYAADMMLILAYHKFADDKNDEKKLRGYAGCMALGSSYKKLQKKYPEICKKVEKSLSALAELENVKSPSIDMTSAAFGDTLEAVFAGYFDDESVNRILSHMGKSLGKWIYLMDAINDYENDIKNGCYNPFIYRKGGLEYVEPVVYNSMAETLNAFDLLEIRKNRGIIENVLLLGMREKTDLILGKGKEDEKSV